VALSNALVAGNSEGPRAPGIGVDIFTQTGGTITAMFSLIGDGTGSGLPINTNGNQVGLFNDPINPRLAPLGNYGGPTQTMALLPGSPAIDRGTSTGAPAADQRGLGRVGAVDVGAFESQGFTLTVTGGDNQSANVGGTFPNLLTVHVTANNPVEPVRGGVVTFTLPATGASGTFASGQTATVPIDAAGNATAPGLIANGTAGSYAVTASTAGAATAVFQLTNTAAGIPPIPPIPPAPPAPPGLNASQRFVFHLYTDLLGRQPSTDEVNFFGTLLDQGLLTREQLTGFFLQSFEYFTHRVDLLYVRLLGRHADAPTLAVAAGFLAAGGQEAQLAAVICGSDEYYQRHGGTNAGFLAGLGQDLTGGPLDPAAISLFTAELAAGTPRDAVAVQALGLPSAAAFQAALLYAQTLHRSASAAELFYPTVLLLQGNETAVLLGLLVSNEYFNRS
jgi:hypothetical protein